MHIFTRFEDFDALVGEELGSSEWLLVDQARIDAFAACTGDYQWIHVDVERSARGPFGATIAHGFLTLALIPALMAQIYVVDTPGPKLNYGADKIRFPAPLPVGSRIRDTATLLSAAAVPAGRQIVVRHVVEIEGETKPACVAELVALLLAG
jgi:acyl dehydratase